MQFDLLEFRVGVVENLLVTGRTYWCRDLCLDAITIMCQRSFMCLCVYM